MTDEPPKAPPPGGQGDVPEKEPTLPGVGPREKTVLGVGVPAQENRGPGAVVPPSVAPRTVGAVAPPTASRPLHEATILGVGNEPKPAALVLAADASVPSVDALAPTAEVAAVPIPPAPVVTAPLPAAAAFPPAPSPPPARAAMPLGEALSPPSARPEFGRGPAPRIIDTRDVDEGSRTSEVDSGIRPAGVPRSGLAWKLFVLVLLGGLGAAGYLHRDRIVREVAPYLHPTAPTATPTTLPSAAPSSSVASLDEAGTGGVQDGAVEDALALVPGSDAALDGSLDAAGDASTKDGGAQDAGKDAGASKDAGVAKDAGVKGAGHAPKTAPSAKPTPSKPTAKPPAKPAAAPPPHPTTE